MKTLWMIVRRSLRHHALSTWVTVISVALAVGLTISVFAVTAQSRRAFAGGTAGFDGVVGARGSPLQLVLNTVFHLETSPGNIPWSTYEALRKDPNVSLAVPYAVGDNYKGFRVVGTTPEIFTKFEYQKGVTFRIPEPGRPFAADKQEAVFGFAAAERTGVRLGDRIRVFHGFEFDPKKQHDEEYVVSGIMEPTNSPSDRVVWIPIDGIFRLGGHVLRGTGKEYTPVRGEPIPDEAKEVSAVMLKFRSPVAGFALDQTINRQGKVATLAFPVARVVTELFDKLGWMIGVLELTAYLVMVVAAASILASLHNTMNERRREFAILRALGARRGSVFSVIVMESTVIAALGCAAGLVVYFVIVSVAASIVRAQVGVVIDVFAWHEALWTVPAAMIALGAVAGLLPAFRAYRTDVAENLVPTS